MKQHYQFTLSLDVYDPQQLYMAARQHPDAVELDDPDELLRDADGGIDAGACLQMLLDPGALPGCQIHSGDAELLSVDGTDD